MLPDLAWPWAALLLLGAVHGVNPAMGWLFAVALGLQERSRRAVWRALAPLAAGHALAMVAALAVAAALGAVVPLRWVRWGVAVALLVVGVRAMRGHRHAIRGGMRVSGGDLTLWSFLMASGHGAGLMALPFVLRAAAPTTHDAAAHGHAAHAAMLGVAAAPTLPAASVIATLLHAAAYLLTTGVIALLVYERLGLRMLRTAWVNLDVVWGGALVLTALLTVAL